MHDVLGALRTAPNIELQIVATGMHLSRSRGRSVVAIAQDGFDVDAVVPWPDTDDAPHEVARATGRATAGLADAFARLRSDIVLVAGDRVEAFAAASAAYISGLIVAHVHGGDRAAGLVDDALRHAISKPAHVHFAATRSSARRLIRMGEDPWRVHHVGAPGVERLPDIAATVPRPSVRAAMIVLHPEAPDSAEECRRMKRVIRAVKSVVFDRITLIYPNNDPGSQGIVRAIAEIEVDERFIVMKNCPRGQFLAALRDAAVLVGNSSSGIIEAGSFGTPVIDIGARQQGREHGRNVWHVPHSLNAMVQQLKSIWNDGTPRRFKPDNPYYRAGTSGQIAQILQDLDLMSPVIRRKLIAY